MQLAYKLLEVQQLTHFLDFMITLTMRPYGGEADLEAIANLINACDAVDQLDEGISVSELRQEFDEPSVDKARDLCLWEDADTQLVGFGQLWIPPTGEVIDGYLWFRVHPRARGGDLERQIMAWGERRMREVSQERSVPVKLRSALALNNPILLHTHFAIALPCWNIMVLQPTATSSQWSDRSMSLSQNPTCHLVLQYVK